MSFKNLFHVNYWFSQPYTAYGNTLWILVGGFLFLIVVGVILRIIGRYQKDNLTKKILARFGNLGMVSGLLGMIWMFFRQERIAFLAWRFWMLLWLLLVIYWLIRILKYILKRVPAIKKEKEEKERLEKYLP